MDKQNLSEDVLERAGKIKLLLMDCDGVLTDGRLCFTESGEAMKVFHVRDGQGIASWHQAGFQSGIISGRDAEKIIGSRTKEEEEAMRGRRTKRCQVALSQLRVTQPSGR